MATEVRSPYQSMITFDGKKVRVVGPLSLLNRLQQLKSLYGSDPTHWKLDSLVDNNDDLLIAELILKINNMPCHSYLEDELCHCRMVTAEKVHFAIKQGVRSVADIARTTLAGTGCGNCRVDSAAMLKSLLKG